MLSSVLYLPSISSLFPREVRFDPLHKGLRTDNVSRCLIKGLVCMGKDCGAPFTSSVRRSEKRGAGGSKPVVRDHALRAGRWWAKPGTSGDTGGRLGK